MMKNPDLKEQLRLLKIIISKAVNELKTEDMINLINLSARAELYLKKKYLLEKDENLESEMEEKIGKYCRYK